MFPKITQSRPVKNVSNQKNKVKRKGSNCQTTNVNTVHTFKWQGDTINLLLSAVRVVFCKTQFPQAVKARRRAHCLDKTVTNMQTIKTADICF